MALKHPDSGIKGSAGNNIDQNFAQMEKDKQGVKHVVYPAFPNAQAVPDGGIFVVIDSGNRYLCIRQGDTVYRTAALTGI